MRITGIVFKGISIIPIMTVLIVRSIPIVAKNFLSVFITIL